MKKIIERSFTFILILSLGINGLLYVFYGVAQFGYKAVAGQHISRRAGLETVRVSLKAFQSKLPDEMWVNGRLYDISSYIVVDDTAFITVLHDEQEESIVKDIVGSFEPYDKYTSDNSTHVCKHRSQPDDGKVLVSRYANNFFCTASVNHPAPCFTELVSCLPSGVIKPPPKPC